MDTFSDLWTARVKAVKGINAFAGRDEDSLSTDERALVDQAQAELRVIDRKLAELAQRNSASKYTDLLNGGQTADLAKVDRLAGDQRMYDWLAARGGIDSDQRNLNFAKILRGLATGTWHDAEAEQRAIGGATIGAGGAMVPTPVAARVIDKARNKARVFQAGAVTVPMESASLKVPRLLTEGTPAWRAEAGSISDQAMTFDQVSLTAQSMAILVKVSIELFEDVEFVDDVVSNSFAEVIALELDRVALRGSGSAPEPRGVLNTSGITTTAHGAAGTVISVSTAYDWHLDAVSVVSGNNFVPGAHIQAPRTSASLRKLREATTSAYLAPPPGMLPMLDTKQVPINLTVGASTDCSEIYTADWSQLLVGIRTSFTLRFLQERFIDNGQYGFLAYLRGDIALAQPSAFVVDVGVRG